MIIKNIVHLLQALILQEKLEEKDQEIERLKNEAQQKSVIEEEKEEKTDSAPLQKERDEEMIDGETNNWVIQCNFVGFN